MFGQYTVESRVKKNKKNQNHAQPYVSIPRRKMDPLEINDLVRKNVRDLVILGGAVYTTKRLADAVYHVAVVLAERKIYG